MTAAWHRAACVAAALALCAMAGCGAVEAPIAATVTLDPSAAGRTVPRLLFGSNLQWQQDGDGLLVNGGNGTQLQPRALEAIERAGVTALRFPGGDLANTYRWKTAVGPMSVREKGRDYGGGLVVQRFGTDEFIALCAAARLAPVMTVNANASISEAVDWVDRLNHPKPQPSAEPASAAVVADHQAVRAVYWEIGNEVFNPNQPGFVSAELYARKVIAFAEAMRARDPSIKIGAVLDASFQRAAWVPKVLPHLVDWNETVLKTAGRSIDFVAVHFYAPQDKLWNDRTLRQLVLASPLELAHVLSDIKVLLRRHARPGTEIALTEFAPAFGDKLVLSKRIATTETALFDALVLFTAMRDPAVTVANNWSLSNNSVFGLIEVRDDGTVSERPTFDVYSLLSPFGGGRSVPLRIVADTTSVAAHGTVPALAAVPLVDAVAVQEQDGGLAVALVNRDDARPAAVRIEGLKTPGQPTATTLTAAPGSAAWTRQTPALRSEAGVLGLQLPPHSLTLVRVPVSSATPATPAASAAR